METLSKKFWSAWYSSTTGIQRWFSMPGIVLGMLFILIPHESVASPPFNVFGHYFTLIGVGTWLSILSGFGLFSAENPKMCFNTKKYSICMELVVAILGVLTWGALFWSTVSYDIIEQTGWHLAVLNCYFWSTMAWVWLLFRAPYAVKRSDTDRRGDCSCFTTKEQEIENNRDRRHTLHECRKLFESSNTLRGS